MTHTNERVRVERCVHACNAIHSSECVAVFLARRVIRCTCKQKGECDKYKTFQKSKKRIINKARKYIEIEYN